uniref:Ig-like domain-containing protein n=1 Tax=Anabas testudineus TaxID=64144 RepID=A0A7N5ZYH3_ANATE
MEKLHLHTVDTLTLHTVIPVLSKDTRPPALLQCVSEFTCQVCHKQNVIWFESFWTLIDSANILSSLSFSDTLKNGPKNSNISVRPFGEIVEGSSVTLTCSSDANPAANYTWYKENEESPKEPQLVFSSIQSSDSGEYYCVAENDLGRSTSEYISINVKYGPKNSNISVRPFGEIVEGSSVTLTCSSDANPAANYTWYKGNQTIHHGPEGTIHFTSISSKDKGTYYCKSENQYGDKSSSISVDVHCEYKTFKTHICDVCHLGHGYDK